MEENLRAKFGAPPMYAAYTSAHIMVTQFVVCAVLLCIIQPPFVLDMDSDNEMPPVLNLCNVLMMSGGAVAATWWLHRSFNFGDKN